MPGVVCQKCGHVGNVRFKRGTRLADIQCPGCGEYQLGMQRRSSQTVKGKTYETCVMCGRRGLYLLHPAFEWEPKYGPYPPRNDERYPAGSACCSIHEPVPAARAREYDVITAIERDFGPVIPPAGIPADVVCEALADAAAEAPRRCPVCADLMHPDRDYELYEDFGSSDYTTFDRGWALMAYCGSCIHTIVLATLETDTPWEERHLLLQAARFVTAYPRQPTGPGHLQRKLHIGFARAARVLERLESEGIVGPPRPTGCRPPLMTEAEAVRTITRLTDVSRVRSGTVGLC